MRRARIFAVLAALALLVTAQRFGLFHLFADPALLKQTLVELGPYGYAAFLGTYTVLQPFGLPGTVFVVAASLIWPWPVAFALSMVGSLTASMAGFSFARFVGREWLAKLLPPRFRGYDDALERRAFATIFALRFVFWMAPLLHVLFGVSKVRFGTHFWASAAAYALPLLVVSYFGQKAFDALRAAPLEVWIGVLATALVLGVVAWVVRRRSRRALAARTARDVAAAADAGQ